MPGQNGPSEKVKEMIDALGGSIWTSCAAAAWIAGGTGTARTSVNAAYRVPDAARTLLGWRPLETVEASAVNESMLAVFDIAGANYKYQPQEVICGCVADAILKDGEPVTAPSEYYDVFAPVQGGETWDVGVEPTDAMANNRESQVEFTWTDVRLPLPVIYSQCSREVGTGTADSTYIAGTALNINNAHKLIEAGAVITGSTKALSCELTVTAELSCTVFSPVQVIQFALEPVGPIFDGTTDFGFPNTFVARRPQRMKFTTDRATVNCNMFIDSADATTAGQFVHYIRWI